MPALPSGTRGGGEESNQPGAPGALRVEPMTGRDEAFSALALDDVGRGTIVEGWPAGSQENLSR